MTTLPPHMARAIRGWRFATLAAATLLLAACAGIAPVGTKGGADAAAQQTPAASSGQWLRKAGWMDDGLSCRPPDGSGQDFVLYTPHAAEDADLWSRVRSGYGLDERVDERRIDGQMPIYVDQQRLFDVVGERAADYLHFVVEELEERDMPLELALLPFVESGYNPGAVSRSSAAGMWQIIPGTGQRLGLEQNSMYDARKDVVASTRAALDYLADLHKRFDGDWYLALAAYNAGEGQVSRAIERNRRLGRPTDYWSLPLPAQACNYVPRLLALSRVLEEPGDHGVAIPPIPDAPAVVPVEIDRRVDLRQAAHLAGMDSSELVNLNPGFKRGYTLANAENTLLVPAAEQDSFLAILDQLPSIAAGSGAQAGVGGNYRIRSGDTLGAIARRHGTTAAAIRAANGMHDDRLVAGHSLVIPGEAPAAAPAPRPVATAAADGRYTVRAGDNLWLIARRLGMPVEQLRRRNGLAADSTLRVGQVLQTSAQAPRAKAPVPAVAQAASTGDVPAADGKRKIGYTVRNGDSLFRIATRFNVEVNAVMRWNGINARRPLIHPGQSLVLYVDDAVATSAS